jgi:hypothetical protein
MAAVPRAAADSQHEEPATTLANVPQRHRKRLDPSKLDFAADSARLGKECGGVTGCLGLQLQDFPSLVRIRE